MTAYYNEIDPFAADWLRELIKARLIAPGEVDTRSIEDVLPADLAGFTQCHFFAGIGGWSLALRQAGWADDRPVWTGSCPCQPFSTAGKGAGFTDERHLWPSFFHLIKECKPITVFGEQVASKDGRTWLNLVSSDLEGVDYTVGAIDTCAAGFGAPHIRQRLYWVATRWLEESHSQRWRGGSARPYQGNSESHSQGDIAEIKVARPSAFDRMGDSNTDRLQGRVQRGPDTERETVSGQAGRNGTIDRVADSQSGRKRCSVEQESGHTREHRTSGVVGGLPNTLCHENRETTQKPATTQREWGTKLSDGCGPSYPQYPSPTNGNWNTVDWLLCRDGKWRPVESLAEPLADGLSAKLGYSRFEGRYSLNPLHEKAENRVMRLRGYGNAIVAPQAEAFIRACMEVV